MRLIGYLDSPFVRRVAITMQSFGIAVAWRFMQHIERVNLEPEDYPALVAFSARAELLPEFMACPVSD
ncbi:MAG: hypothetical protein QNK19_10305 [Xanthomonadales bacterium]|nr:hypothetical protein [Xanthomonadales bacterium]